MEEVGKYICAGRSKKIGTDFQAERTFHEVTHSPSNVKSGADLTVKVPKLDELLIDPETLALTFDLDVVLDPDAGNTVNNYPVNNLAANIIKEITIKINSKPVYTLDNAHLYNTYRDLWLTEKKRANLVYEGIQDEELRKMRTNLNATLADVKAYNTELKHVYGKRYRLPLNFELLSNHMPIPTGGIKDEITIHLKINTKDYVLKYSKNTADFTMNNICLQYETLRSPELSKSILNQLEYGFSFLFDDVQYYKKEAIAKNKTQGITLDVKVDRKSLKGILLLFQNEFTAGERDSEEFPNPKITNIKLQIGVPNKLYNTGYKYMHQWDEICRHYSSEEFKNGHHSYIDLRKYYCENKFALWFDFRATEDNDLHGVGKEQDSGQEIKIEISKMKTGEGEYMMYIFVVADARIVMKNKKFGDVQK